MIDFSVASLVAGCSASCFAATVPHVTRNKNGTFFGLITAQDDVNFRNQTLQVFWLKNDGVTLVSLMSVQCPSNAPAVESFETGEVFALWSDFVNGAITVRKWQDVTLSQTPTDRVYTGAGTANGKFTTTVDNQRRCIWLTGLSGYHWCFDQDGSLRYSQPLLSGGSQGPDYQTLSLDDDGKLYLTWCGSPFGSVVDYASIMALMTPLARPAPGALPFWTSKWSDANGVYSWTLPPISPDGSIGQVQWLNTGDMQAGMSNLLCGSLASGGRLFTLSAENPYYGGKFFDSDDLRNCTMAMVAPLWSNGPWGIWNQESVAYTKRPLRGETITPRAVSGSVVRRGGNLYVVAHDANGNLVALRSADGGKSWNDYARTQVPGFVFGSNMLHYAQAWRGNYGDADIVGVVQMQSTSPSQWASGVGGPPWPAQVFRWSLPAN